MGKQQIIIRGHGFPFRVSFLILGKREWQFSKTDAESFPKKEVWISCHDHQQDAFADLPETWNRPRRRRRAAGFEARLDVLRWIFYPWSLALRPRLGRFFYVGCDEFRCACRTDFWCSAGRCRREVEGKCFSWQVILRRLLPATDHRAVVHQPYPATDRFARSSFLGIWIPGRPHVRFVLRFLGIVDAVDAVDMDFIPDRRICPFILPAIFVILHPSFKRHSIFSLSGRKVKCAPPLPVFHDFYLSNLSDSNADSPRYLPGCGSR